MRGTVVFDIDGDADVLRGHEGQLCHDDHVPATWLNGVTRHGEILTGAWAIGAASHGALREDLVDW